MYGSFLNSSEPNNVHNSLSSASCPNGNLSGTVIQGSKDMMARRKRGVVGSLGDRDTVEQGTTPMRVVYVWEAITGVNVDQ